MTTENQQLETTEKKPQTGIQKVSSFLNSEAIKSKFTDILGSKGQGFIASVLAACNQNELLKKASTESIYSAALMAATLDLPINPNLGFAFLIPYAKNVGKPNETVECQFQIAARGFKQLAQRSGQYHRISDAIVYEGQLKSENPLEGFEFDWTQKSDKVIGYVSYFRLINGFESTLYMTKEKMELHALKYSQTYKSNTQWVKASSKWTTEFDAMALKTVTKLNLSKNGPMSIEMQRAVLADQAVLNEDGSAKYIDNQEAEITTVDKEAERIQLMVNDCKSIEELEALQVSNPDIDIEIFNARKEAINASSK
jgi:recombination protein RecT